MNDQEWEQELREMYRAAAVIKEICNRRTEDDSCRKCPFYTMCGAEPYSWAIPESGVDV